MTVSLAGVGQQSQLLHVLQKHAPSEAAVAASPVAASPVPTSSAQNLTALASFLTQIGSSESISADGQPSDASTDTSGGDSSDSLLTQLESDLKSLFSDLQSTSSGAAGTTKADPSSNASDSLLSNLENSFKMLFPDLLSPPHPSATEATSGDAGDSLLAKLESDLKNLFADLHPGASAGTSGAVPSGEASDASSQRLWKVIDAYAAETSATDNTLTSNAA